MKRFFIFGIIILPILLTACQKYAVTSDSTPEVVKQETIINPTSVPNPTPISTPTNPNHPLSLTREAKNTYWFDDSIPVNVQTALCFPEGVSTANSKSQAGAWLTLGRGSVLAYRSVYALAGRFDLLVDGVTMGELKSAWQGQGEWNLAMSHETYQGFKGDWGATNSILIVDDLEELVNQVWNTEGMLIILPFDNLIPRLKVLNVDGMSVLDKKLNTIKYPLTLNYYWQGDPPLLNLMNAACEPGTNRDLAMLTDVLMSGVSALTRGTAAKMVEEGVTYPARDILNWLKAADITHISHEVSFFIDCPDPLPIRAGGRFCAQPEFLELFIHAGVDVVELTGNHLNDWGTDALIDSISMYQEAGIKLFGGGINAETARQPLLVEHNGNRLAFLGCNATGPDSDWAKESLPGSAYCDLDWLSAEVSRLKNDGYLPIVTFQAFEICDYAPHSSQRVLADQMVGAGAVIVSGSQAHCPQAYRIEGETFIHYGLGNLWFDQMDWLSRQETLDRHVFYNGRHISTEIFTAILEDSARPRPMTADERRFILEMIFNASQW